MATPNPAAVHLQELVESWKEDEWYASVLLEVRTEERDVNARMDLDSVALLTRFIKKNEINSEKWKYIFIHQFIKHVK